MWCGTPCLTATFPHGLVQSQRRIRPGGRRWRVASYQRKVVEMRRSSHLPEGPQRAGGDPAPGNVATTRLPGAGVREHPAPLGALRQDLHLVRGEIHDLVREHPAPLGALRQDLHLVRGEIHDLVREHPAPLGALRRRPVAQHRADLVREHPAPLGALRRHHDVASEPLRGGQVTPRTAIARIGLGSGCGLVLSAL